MALMGFKSAARLLGSCQILSLGQYLPIVSTQLGSCRAFAVEAAPEKASSATYGVPAGHANSDLSDAACNIALSRRRDLTLREDLALYAKGKRLTLRELLKVHFLRGKHCCFSAVLPRTL
jgi:hypothetical protein